MLYPNLKAAFNIAIDAINKWIIKLKLLKSPLKSLSLETRADIS